VVIPYGRFGTIDKSHPQGSENLGLWRWGWWYVVPKSLWAIATLRCSMNWYICQLQLGWHPVAAVQYTFTHKQLTTKQHE
jgi:hypothetical protein